jgi:hypothetical protein
MVLEQEELMALYTRKVQFVETDWFRIGNGLVVNQSLSDTWS